MGVQAQAGPLLFLPPAPSHVPPTRVATPWRATLVATCRAQTTEVKVRGQAGLCTCLY